MRIPHAFEGRGAINFLALNSRIVSEEGHVVDTSNIVELPTVKDRLKIPEFKRSTEDTFLQRVQASGKKWVILTDPKGTAHLLLNAHRFLRAVFAERSVDVHDYCATPIVMHDANETLEQVLMNVGPAKQRLTERGIILLWGTEKRIIDHTDLLRRLFEGVLSPPPVPKPI